MWEVYDDDEGGDYELIGSTETTLSEIITAPNATFQSSLMHDNRLRGTLKVRADWLNVSGDTLDFECQAFLVSKRVLCCGTDNPFILFERARVLNEPEVPALTPRATMPDNKETESAD